MNIYKLKTKKRTLSMRPIIGRIFPSEPLKEIADMTAPMTKNTGEISINAKIGTSTSYMITLLIKNDIIAARIGTKGIKIPITAFRFLLVFFLGV